MREGIEAVCYTFNVLVNRREFRNRCGGSALLQMLQAGLFRYNGFPQEWAMKARAF